MLKVTDDGTDLARSHGSFDTIDEATEPLAAVGQSVRMELATQLGGYAFDATIGWDILGMLQAGVPDVARRAEITRVVRKQPGVLEVRDLKITRDRATRAAAVTMKVVATDGAVDFTDLGVG